MGQAYGPTGGYWPVQEAARAAILGPFFTVNRSFFMSLFFMISGYFMVAAFERHTVGEFIRSRLVRLGIPVLLFTAIMLPSRIFLFGDHFTRWDTVVDAGHLWYLEHVLLFSIVYALWKTLRGKRDVARHVRRPRPRRESWSRSPPSLSLQSCAESCGSGRRSIGG